jgi:hypothetical protein
MKQISEDKPNGVIIDIYKEISQGKFLCSYLISTKRKCHVFFFILYLVSSIKSLNKRAGQVLWVVVVVGLVPIGGEQESLNKMKKYFKKYNFMDSVLSQLFI